MGLAYQRLFSRQGTSGVTCLVERTAWEQADFRNDIYVPLCYNAEGSKSYLKVIVDAARLRSQGMTLPHMAEALRYRAPTALSGTAP